ncbi:MAG: DUF3899 domain-containing protein [Gammaproteobacteria bacterium]|nr:DUF3899 domain-containing protein [Gammaproteobacteria bacterium]
MKFRNLFVHSPFRYIFALVYTIGIVVLYNGLRKDFVSLVNYANGTFIAGFSLILFGALVVVKNHGGFDIWQYMFVKRNPDGSRETLYDFSERKKLVRASKRYDFMPYEVVGVLVSLISLILLLIN